jgi:Uncharacterized protein conserved in bacteria (DUF2188)
VIPIWNGWRVEIEGSEHTRSIHATQAQARAAALELACKRKKREVLIQDREGRISEWYARRRSTAYESQRAVNHGRSPDILPGPPTTDEPSELVAVDSADRIPAAE